MSAVKPTDTRTLPVSRLLEWSQTREALKADNRALRKALRDLMNYTGGWAAPLSHPCGRAAKILNLRQEGKHR